jgi:phosphopantothenoylcysteine decarboxylase/phosphopantothenate--cysteine ligase
MKGREILIGVTGGIAAYKTAALVSRLVQNGAGVTVVMTEAGARFVGPTTFSALSGRNVYTGLFDEREFPGGGHIPLAERAELMCVAPATANFLAKAAHGLADDLLSTVYLAFPGPVMLAPAMNSQMWASRAVQRNVQRLRDDGVLFVGPDDGWLACRTEGPGRMSSPEDIFAAIEARFAASAAKPG